MKNKPLSFSTYTLRAKLVKTYLSDCFLTILYQQLQKNKFEIRKVEDFNESI